MNTSGMQIEIFKGSAAFRSCGIQTGRLVPAVRIKAGENETPVSLLLEQPLLEKQVKTNTYAGPAMETTFAWKTDTGYGFQWTVNELEKLNGFALKGSFYNGSDHPVRLSEIVLGASEQEGIHCEGDPCEWLLSTLAHETRIGTLGEMLPSINEDTIRMWEGFGLPIPFALSQDEKSTDGSWRVYKDFLTLYTANGAKGLAIGPVGNPEADIRYDCKVTNDKLGLTISSEMTDVLVEPGCCRDSQEVLILAEPCEFALKTLLNWITSTHGHRTHRGPVVGWCSWYDLAQNITEESVLSTVTAFTELKDRIKVDVLQIDDGYQTQVGAWEPNEKFPNGFGAIIQKTREAGVMPGIWLAPLAVHETTGLIDAHPDWFQRDSKGELLGECNNWGPKGRWLDPTHPGAQEFLRKTIRDKKAEGFTYFKIDFNTIDGGCRLHNPYKTRLQAFRDLYALYREEMGEEAYLLSCSGFSRGTVGYADASRIGPDSCHIWSAAHPCTILESIRATGMNALANGIFYANDPDVSYLRTRGSFNPIGDSDTHNDWDLRLTLDELRIWHSFVGLLGGLALISDPVHKPEFAEHLRMLEIMNPPAPEKAASLTPGTDRDHSQFGFLYSRPWGISAAVLLWNPSDKPTPAKINLQALEPLGSDFHVWSFWDERYLGRGREAIESCILPSHGCLLLKLSAAAPLHEGPVLAGSSLHLSMGAAEVDCFASMPSSVSITLNKGGSRDGSLHLYSERPLSLAECTGCTAELTQIQANIWKLDLSNRSRTATQTISIR